MAQYTDEELKDIGNTDYSLILDPEHEDRFAVRINDGPYKDLIYSYDKIIPKETEKGTVMQFDYDIMTLPTGNRYLRKRIQKKKGLEFFAMERMVAAILSELMEDVSQLPQEEPDDGSKTALDEFADENGE